MWELVIVDQGPGSLYCSLLQLFSPVRLTCPCLIKLCLDQSSTLAIFPCANGTYLEAYELLEHVRRQWHLDYSVSCDVIASSPT